MDDEATRKIVKWLAWCGPAWVVTYLVTWGIMGHDLPCPGQADTSAAFVTNYYIRYRTSIEYGQALAACVGALYMPWSVVLSYQMWQREKVPLLSLLQLSGGILTAFLIVCTAAVWTWCARWAGTPGVDPELIKTVHFATWYVFDMTYNVTNVQILGCGLFAILDKRKPTIFPAWLGWLGFATALSFFTETVMPFHDSGPLAINGWWNFHVGFLTWFVWFSSYSFYVMKEANRTRAVPSLPMAQAVRAGGSL